jgi:hypothetical protein
MRPPIRPPLSPVFQPAPGPDEIWYLPAVPKKATRNPGIYKLTSSSWTICLATQGTERPRKFASHPGTGIALETLERKPPAKPRAAKVARQAAPIEEHAIGDGTATEIEGEWAMLSGVFNGQPLQPD